MDKKNNKLHIIAIPFLTISFIFLLIVISEISLGYFMGLGTPILYDSNLFYGYRPVPNQDIKRFRGARIKINNLGLRANENWDDTINDKILFLGDSITYGGSHIDNKELFSYTSLKKIPKYKSGNAGVNGWGVENIYGLIVESNFRPAKIYITTLGEDDFYRGLTRIQGMPVFNQGPNYALMELWYFICYNQNNKRYKSWLYYAKDEEKKAVIEKAVKKLKEMDSVIKENHGSHLIFITPTRSQVYDKSPKEPLVRSLLMEYKIKPNYILDDLTGADVEEKNIFCDYKHLDNKGHEIWGKIIGRKILELL
jgi:hypothetical protein